VNPLEDIKTHRRANSADVYNRTESCFKGSFPFCSFSLENTYKRVPYSVYVLSAKYRVQHENEAANLLLGERNACFAEKVEF
jgi:hypothetical protein